MDNHNEKNFRSSYYTKVGFRKVEERKSIEAFLSPKVDIAKIKLFLKSYALPELHRLRVWRILLGIHEPETEENQELKRINCEQLNRSVSILAPEELLVSESQRIALMVILARGDSKQPLIEQVSRNVFRKKDIDFNQLIVFCWKIVSIRPGKECAEIGHLFDFHMFAQF